MAAPIILTILSYLLGSIPAGFLVGSSAGVDVRSAGSGNIGATNVARTLGWKKGLVTLFADVAKGFLPVMAAHLLELGEVAAAAAGLAAFAGHLYPVFLRFKGGKGVATAAGVYLAAMPLGILVVLGGVHAGDAGRPAGITGFHVGGSPGSGGRVGAFLSRGSGLDEPGHRYPGGAPPQGQHPPSDGRGRAPVQSARLVAAIRSQAFVGAVRRINSSSARMA